MLDPNIKTYLSGAAAVVLLALAAGAATLAMKRAAPEPPSTDPAPLVRTNHPVHIHQRSGPPQIDTGIKDFHGQAVTVACSTCHATARPNPHLRDAADLRDFHQGLKFNHGNLSCLSCHNADNYDTLRLADGAPVQFQNFMQLCAQCHGPQTRDFHNGSHGGMSGFWDLNRGPRTRNSCLDCHDAHAPQYPAMMPVFPPAPTGKPH
jgi:hypothetical protein